MQTAEWHDWDEDEPSESSGLFCTTAGWMLLLLDEYRDEPWEEPGQ